MSIANHVRAEMTAVIARHGVMVGLFVGDKEVSGPEYERLTVEWTEAQEIDGVVFSENVNRMLFSDHGAERTVDRFALFDADGGFVGDFSMLRPRTLEDRDQTLIRVGELKIGMP